MRVLPFVAVLLAFSVSTADAGSTVNPAGRQLRLPQPVGAVFHVRVRMRDHVWHEWVAPKSGHCRRGGDRVEISTATIRATINPPSWGPSAGAIVRSGSPPFVRGTLGRECAALGVSLRGGRATRVRWHGAVGVAAVENVLTAKQAIDRGLFTLGSARVRGYDLELGLRAKPRFPVAVYWLGPSFRKRRAVRAIEHFDQYDSRRPANRAYSALYARLNEAGASSALPGSRAPAASELQISSMPATGLLARRTIAHFEEAHRQHGWPRIPVTTADGANAVLYLNLGEGRPFTNFTVRVGRTLVGVTAGRGLTEADTRSIASRLRRR